MDVVIHKKIKETVDRYFDIIQNNLPEFGMTKEKMKMIEKCCDDKQTADLQQVILWFLPHYRLRGGKADNNLLVEVIVFYYFHMVLVETLYNPLLETDDVTQPYGPEYTRQFRHLLVELMASNKREFAEVRRKFLALNPKPFQPDAQTTPTTQFSAMTISSPASNSRKRKRGESNNAAERPLKKGGRRRHHPRTRKTKHL